MSHAQGVTLVAIVLGYALVVGAPNGHSEIPLHIKRSRDSSTVCALRQLVISSSRVSQWAARYSFTALAIPPFLYECSGTCLDISPVNSNLRLALPEADAHHSHVLVKQLFIQEGIISSSRAEQCCVGYDYKNISILLISSDGHLHTEYISHPTRCVCV